MKVGEVAINLNKKTDVDFCKNTLLMHLQVITRTNLHIHIEKLENIL